MAIIALIVIGFLYLYNNPKVVSKQTPVYYPEYVPVRRPRGFRPYPGGRFPGHHPGHHPRYQPGKDWHVGSDGKYLPADKGGVIPFTPF